MSLVRLKHKMRRAIRPFMILFAGFVMTTSLSFAKPEYTKKEKKPCATCHVTATSKELPNLPLKSLHRFFGSFQLRFVMHRHAIAKELTVPRSIHSALCLIDFES